MRYLKEIVRAKVGRKHIPGILDLISQYSNYTHYLKARDVFANAIPWITFSAIRYLERYLTKEMSVFEFGGGGSTLFFAARVNRLVTVEHDRTWFDDLKKNIPVRAGLEWTPLMIEGELAEDTNNLLPGEPDHYFSANDDYKGKVFHKYASAIDRYADGTFDLVLIDGRVRPSCMKHSALKVKVGGLLILDNAERDYYLERIGNLLGKFTLVLDDHGPTPYSNTFTQTKIWRRTN
jgi:predicted O-methyltransferase YrrM